ncbi:MAG TPA: UbiA family prenyltransferase [Myxococcales bacterium]
MRDLFAALRFHIVAIAVCATVLFGDLFRDAWPFGLALLCGFDWCLVNLLNRATDVEEDRLNAIAATELVARHAKAIVAGCLVLLFGSLLAGAFLLPWPLAVDRAVFHAIGLGYSYRIVPTPKGFKRFKDLYVLKNSMSAVLFLLSVIAYPLLGLDQPLRLSPWAIGALALYFFLFEHTFEIIYDLRDLEGDRAVGVPTYPVKHGSAISARIVYVLCALSMAVLLVARLSGVILMRELMLIVAPAAQWAFLRWRTPDKVTRADCIGITYAGAGTLLFYLACTSVWIRAGLPVNF